jgi:hypothetical protein
MGFQAERVSDMAENRKLMDGPVRSAFLDSAARLDRIARPSDQNGEAPLTAAPDRMAAVSPDEAWSRRFMSMGIGPDLSRPLPPVPQPELAPREEIAPEPALRREFSKPGKPMPIGLAIGKPMRRSLLARVFGRN